MLELDQLLSVISSSESDASDIRSLRTKCYDDQLKLAEQFSMVLTLSP